ncbi:MAG: hypothetical protein RL264_1554 [Bacteroidota bacterium]
MRIISGKLKGKRFTVPKGFPSRPTTDFAKEGLFNILDNRIDIEGCHVLDLCSGTGNITFEFASRGAKHVTAVDYDIKSVQWLRKNAQAFGILNNLSAIKSDIVQFCQLTSSKFDLIFTDPPFHHTYHEELIKVIQDRELLLPEGMLVVEHGKKTDLSHLPNFDCVRSYGNVSFSFFVNDPL